MTDLPLPEPVAYRLLNADGVPCPVFGKWVPAGYWESCNALVFVPREGARFEYAYAENDVHAYAAAKTAELQAECARLRGDANAWQDDAFTILGHAEVLRSQGETDMPAYFYGLAERICRVHVDEAHAQRMRELADAALRGKDTK